MSTPFLVRWLHPWMVVLRLGVFSPRGAEAQLSGTFRTAPGTFAKYEYHADGFQVVMFPVDVSMRFSSDTPTSMLSATIHQLIISVDEHGVPLYPMGAAFPMDVAGTSTDGRDFYGNLLDTPYLFHWDIEPVNDGELLWNGRVFWSGGRYEETTITNARLMPVHAESDGDNNLDGRSDAADYIAWRKGMSPFTNSQSEYDLWRTQFGQTIGPGASSGVPEPALMRLCGSLIFAAGFLRRRH
jgi:hypothetical protein